MRRLLSSCLLLSLMTLVAADAWAQAAATAELHVTVKDPNGAVVRNATVAVRNLARNIERSTRVNQDGQYQFLLLPPGDYTVSVEAQGFAKLVANSVRVTVGQIAELPVALRLATVSETVTVSTEAAIVETQRTSSSTTIEQRNIENLPINGRNYINFTLIDSKVTRDTAPSIGAAPTSGINFGGERARSNLVNVDGEDAVDNSTNGIRSTVSQEAVQEFQILTNGYAAEYGRASGGVVNIITKSGTNDLHGSAFGYLRNRDFQAVNPFSNVPNPAYTRVQTGLTLAGPIQKDKTFFFFSYETTRRHETGFSTIGRNNFGLVQFDTAAIGRPFGTVLLSPDQVAFLTNPAVLAAQAPTAPPALRAAVTSAVNNYLVLGGGSSGVALNGAWPALAGLFGSPSVFPTSGAPLPPSFVPLTSLEGNYPVSEGTSIWSLRLDHKFSNNQQGMLRVGVSPSTVTGIQVNAQNQDFGQNAYSRTSQQTFRDVDLTAQHTWEIGANKVNEFRFQFARRGLLYNFSSGPGGSGVGVDIPGYAFLGREPFSFVRRRELRYQFTDNFSILKGSHNFKFGADVNHLPLEADFTVNFGGLFKFGTVDAASLGFPTALTIPQASGAPVEVPVPGFSPLQAYGLGIPQVFVQGIGNPHDKFANTPLGLFWQDTWRISPQLTLNYGVRYDVEFSPVFKAVNQMSTAAQNALGITQGIPRDYDNFAPRIGLAWNPRGNGKMVVRASYGIFYDHPLLALAFDSDVADGAQAPQVLLFGGSPSAVCSPSNLNATNVFQGILQTGCPGMPVSLGYLPNQQRFNDSLPNSAWINQNYLAQGVPLIMQPFGFPVGNKFQYGYANQANLTIERDLGHDFAMSLEYNFNGGRRLARPINVNASRSDLMTLNWQRAAAAAVAAGQAPPSSPVFVSGCGLDPTGAPYVPAALVSFFRPSGLNPSLAAITPAPCLAFANSVLQSDGLGLGVSVPFSDMVANLSNGTSVYHGLTASLRKRFNAHYEFLASYTWSHAIDDSTDLQSLLEPQNNYQPNADRSASTFDQRQRFVFSGVYQSGKISGTSLLSRFFSNWMFAPIVEFSSGRPFNILTGTDRNFDFSASTDRPMVVPAGSGTNSCGDPVVASKYSPTGLFQLPCFLDGTFAGNLSRNAGVRPSTLFTDLRVSRRIKLAERLNLEAIADVFNLINKFNVADVNSLFTEAGTPTAAFDPRQFQFALRLTW